MIFSKHPFKTKQKPSRAQRWISSNSLICISLLLRFKKYCVLTLIIFIFSGLLFAGTQKAKGVGTTEDAARQNAITNLAAQLKSRVQTTHRLYSRTFADDNSIKSDETFLTDTSVTVSIDLFGVKFEEPAKVGKEISIVAFIDDASLPQYLNQLASIKENIEILESNRQKLSDFFELRNNLLLLLDYHDEFFAYATIAQLLDPQAKLPELKNTKAGVELDLLNLLEKENEFLLGEQIRLEEEIQSAALRDHAIIKLQVIKQQIESNRLISRQWEEDQKKKQQEVILLADLKLQQLATKMQQDATLATKRIVETYLSTNPMILIQQIESHKQILHGITTEAEHHISAQASIINERYDNEIYVEQNKTFRAAEMVASIPTEAALKRRDSLIEALEIERSHELEKSKQLFYGKIEDELNTVRASILLDYRELETKSYTINSIINEMVIKVDSYDGFRKSWPIAIRFTIMGIPFSYDLYLPYESITGKKVPNESKQDRLIDRQIYEEYLDEVDLFDTYFASIEQPLACTYTYSLSIGSEPSEYVIIPKSLSVIRLDTSTSIYTHTFLNFLAEAESYIHNPPISIDLGFESFFIKEQIKEQKRIAKRDELNPQNQKYRSGLYVGISISQQTNPYTDNLMSMSANPKVTYYRTVLPYSYVGISLGWYHSFLQAVEPSLYNQNVEFISLRDTVGLHAVAGFIYPWKIRSLFIKPFVEVHFAVTQIFDFNLSIYSGLLFALKTKKDFLDNFGIGIKYDVLGESIGLFGIEIGYGITF